MPKVKIDTPGVTIELEVNEGSIEDLSKQAMDMFREATAINNGIPSGATGSLHNELRHVRKLGFGSWTYDPLRPEVEAKMEAK